MSVFTAILIGLAMGVVFGFALEKSRVFEPGVIVGQMQLRNFTMLKIFLSAVITGLIVLAAMHGAGLIKLHPKATLLAADVVGGLLLGSGIALAGACPGTVFAQIGAGYRDRPPDPGRRPARRAGLHLPAARPGPGADDRLARGGCTPSAPDFRAATHGKGDAWNGLLRRSAA